MNDNNQPIGILIQELELRSGKQSMNYYLMKNYISCLIAPLIWTKIETRDCSFEYEKHGFLLEMKCKLIVVACKQLNAIQELRAKYDIPFIGIETSNKTRSYAF
jgi:glutamate racemase